MIAFSFKKQILPMLCRKLENERESKRKRIVQKRLLLLIAKTYLVVLTDLLTLSRLTFIH